MNFTRFVVFAFILASLGACKEEGDDPSSSAAVAAESPPPSQPAMQASTAQPLVVVYKNASCGCCGMWVEHMQAHGFSVEVHDVDNLGPIKERVGLPHGMGSCHTAEVGGYFIEGHVPAAEVQRLLAEKPEARGLAVPGMPIGSPGMEQGDRVDPYEVHLVHADGSTSVYAKYPR